MLDLTKGIFLEEINFLLEWGQPTAKLVSQIDANVEKVSVGFVVNWGNNEIFDGLKVNLSSKFDDGTTFESIEYEVDGDNESLEKYKLISNHLYHVFGEPHRKDDANFEKTLYWQIKDVSITLSLFEIFGQNILSLHLKIEKESSLITASKNYFKNQKNK